MTHPWLLAVVAVGIGFLWHQGGPKKAGSGAPGAPRAKMTRADFRRRLPGYLVGVAFLFGGVGWLMHYKVQGVLLGVLCLAGAALLTYRDRQKAKRAEALKRVNGCCASIHPSSELTSDQWAKKRLLFYGYSDRQPPPDEATVAKLEYNLGVLLQQPVKVTPYPPGGYYTVQGLTPEPPPVEVPPFVALEPNLLPDKPRQIPLGLSLAGGKVVAWDPKFWPHLLVPGDTGKGKSSLIRTVIIGCLAAGWKVYGCDPKQISVGPMRVLPGVEEVAETQPDMERLIHRVEEERARRLDDLKHERVVKEELQPVLLVLDEAATMIRWAEVAWKDARRQGLNPTMRDFMVLCALARECEIHILVGTQQPNADIIPTESRDQFGFWACMGEVPSDFLSRKLGKKIEEVVEGDWDDNDEATIGLGYCRKGKRVTQFRAFYTPEPRRRMADRDRAILDKLVPGWSSNRIDTPGVEPQARHVSRSGDVGSDEVEGAEKNTHKVRLRLVSDDEGAGQGASDEEATSDVADGVASDFCLEHRPLKCSSAYRWHKCKCDHCRAWQSRRLKAAKG